MAEYFFIIVPSYFLYFTFCFIFLSFSPVVPWCNCVRHVLYGRPVVILYLLRQECIVVDQFHEGVQTTEQKAKNIQNRSLCCKLLFIRATLLFIRATLFGIITQHVVVTTQKSAFLTFFGAEAWNYPLIYNFCFLSLQLLSINKVIFVSNVYPNAT